MIDREKAYKEFRDEFASKNEYYVLESFSAKRAFNAALDLMEKEIARIKAQIPQAVIDELRRSDELHGDMNSIDTGLKVVMEELGELSQAVLQREFEKRGRSDRELRGNIIEEATQLAAMGLKMYRYVINNVKARGCAACDRGDYQLGHAEWCEKVTPPESEVSDE